MSLSNLYLITIFLEVRSLEPRGLYVGDVIVLETGEVGGLETREVIVLEAGEVGGLEQVGTVRHQNGARQKLNCGLFCF